MYNVRCYFKDGEALGRVDVSQVDSYNAAIEEVKFLLWQGGVNTEKLAVLAVVK